MDGFILKNICPVKFFFVGKSSKQFLKLANISTHMNFMWSNFKIIIVWYFFKILIFLVKNATLLIQALILEMIMNTHCLSLFW